MTTEAKVEDEGGVKAQRGNAQRVELRQDKRSPKVSKVGKLPINKIQVGLVWSNSVNRWR
jgi:hypothetical protein